MLVLKRNICFGDEEKTFGTKIEMKKVSTFKIIGNGVPFPTCLP
jgi:hypothetical protein